MCDISHSLYFTSCKSFCNSSGSRTTAPRTYAVDSIRDRLRCITEEIEDWKYLSFPLPGQEVVGETNAGYQKSPAYKSDENEDGPATG